MADGSELARRKRMAPRPEVRPSTTLNLFTGLAFCVLGYATSAPGGYFTAFGLGFLLTLFTAAFWLLMLVRARRHDDSAACANWKAWALAPMLALLLVLRVPLYTRFLASLPAMNAAADEAWRASHDGEFEYWSPQTRGIGLYGDCRVRVDPDARSVIIHLWSTGLFNSGGFARVEGHETPRNTADRYSPLFGNWRKVIFD